MKNKLSVITALFLFLFCGWVYGVDIERGNNRVILRFADNSSVSFHTSGSSFLGMGEITANGIKVKNEMPYTFPLIRTTAKKHYRQYQLESVEKNESGAVLTIKLITDETSSDRLVWVIQEDAFQVYSKQYKGISYYYRFESEKNMPVVILDKTHLGVGGNAVGNIMPVRTAFFADEVTIEKEKEFNTSYLYFSKPLNRFGNIASFDFYQGKDGILIVFFDRAAPITSLLYKKAGSDLLWTLDYFHPEIANNTGTVRKRIVAAGSELRTKTDVINDYTDVQQQINEYYRGLYGIAEEQYLPTIRVQKPFNEIERNLEQLYGLGFKRLWIGAIWVSAETEYNERGYGMRVWDLEPAQAHGGTEALRELTRKARTLGMSLFAWTPAAHMGIDAPILKKHPDWVVRDIDGFPLDYQYTTITAINLNNESAYDYFDKKLTAVKRQSGIGGLWLDSFSGCGLCTYYNYEKPTPSYATEKILKLISTLMKEGLYIYAEGYTPFAISSTSLMSRHHFYKGYEYRAYKTCFNNCEPAEMEVETYRKHVIPVADIAYFKLAANKALPILSAAISLTDDEAKKILRKVNGMYNQVEGFMYRRVILPDEKGVLWISADGKARVLFSYKPMTYDAHGYTVKRIYADKREDVASSKIQTGEDEVYLMETQRQ